MRINNFVLDPNIYISYFISKRQNILLEIAANNKLTFFICDELIVESKRVLGYGRLAKYEIDIYDSVRFVKNIGTNAELSYPIKRYITEDQNDDYLIALALQTSSGFITTGDKDILLEKENLEKKYKKLVILTKAEFEKKFLPA
jgi:uncharacterized protein